MGLSSSVSCGVVEACVVGVSNGNVRGIVCTARKSERWPSIWGIMVCTPRVFCRVPPILTRGVRLLSLFMKAVFNRPEPACGDGAASERVGLGVEGDGVRTILETGVRGRAEGDPVDVPSRTVGCLNSFGVGFDDVAVRGGVRDRVVVGLEAYRGVAFSFTHWASNRFICRDIFPRAAREHCTSCGHGILKASSFGQILYVQSAFGPKLVKFVEISKKKGVVP